MAGGGWGRERRGQAALPITHRRAVPPPLLPAQTQGDRECPPGAGPAPNNPADVYAWQTASGLTCAGRIVLNVWRLMRDGAQRGPGLVGLGPCLPGACLLQVGNAWRRSPCLLLLASPLP